MKKNNIFWLFLIYFGVIVLQNLNWGDRSDLMYQLLYRICPLIAVFSGFYVTNKIGWGSGRSGILKSVLLALVFWLFGEIHNLYTFIMEIDSYPTIADLFYIIGYGVFAAGIYKEVMLFGLDLKNISKKLLIPMIMLLAVIYSVSIYITVTQGYNPEETLLYNLTIFSWSIGDMIMGTLGVTLVLMANNFGNAIAKRPWFWFLTANFINLATDTIYNVYPDASIDGSLLSLFLNSLWMLAYIFFAAYFWETYRGIQSIQEKLLSKQDSSVE